MSIHYVQCFDLIPEAIVPALKLGMDPRSWRALAGYEQLHWAFKVEGNLGSWWKATSGILKGCPWLVILGLTPCILRVPWLTPRTSRTPRGCHR